MHPLHLTPEQLALADARAGDLTLAPKEGESPDRATALRLVEQTLTAWVRKTADCGSDDPATLRAWDAHLSAKLTFAKINGRLPENAAGIWF